MTFVPYMVLNGTHWFGQSNDRMIGHVTWAKWPVRWSVLAPFSYCKHQILRKNEYVFSIHQHIHKFCLDIKFRFTQCQMLDVCPCILPGGSGLVFDSGVGCRFQEFFSCRKLKFYLWVFLTGHVVDEGYYCTKKCLSQSTNFRYLCYFVR